MPSLGFMWLPCIPAKQSILFFFSALSVCVSVHLTLCLSVGPFKNRKTTDWKVILHGRNICVMVNAGTHEILVTFDLDLDLDLDSYFLIFDKKIVYNLKTILQVLSQFYVVMYHIWFCKSVKSGRDLGYLTLRTKMDGSMLGWDVAFCSVLFIWLWVHSSSLITMNRLRSDPPVEH